LITSNIYAQSLFQVSGVIIDAEGDAIPFANILVEETGKGTSADGEGIFHLAIAKQDTYNVIVSAVGYRRAKQVIAIQSDVEDLVIKMEPSSLQLDQVVVTGTMKETYLKDSPVKVEVISAAFLKTNPTNNVIEAIQTVNGVQEQINCGVCGTNDIHINGLEGPYTLVLIDGMPIMSALASVYGFNGIPTALVDRIEIVKGPSSTLYGTSAVGGVINVITKRPEKMPLMSYNSFYTSHREWNTDLAFSPNIGGKVFTTVSANYYRNQYRMDFNDDNFTDVPLNNRLSLFNKWSIRRANHKPADLAVRYYREERFGGVLEWQQNDTGSDQVYGEFIDTERIEVIGSYGLPISAADLRVDYSVNFHDQDSYYGDTRYKANQSVWFANLIWDNALGKHNVLTGLTLRRDHYQDNSLANTSDTQFIPGVFIQDEWKVGLHTTLLSGVRFDQHRAHGLIVSPRINLKQDLSKTTALRLNLGTGFRRVNLFTEDHAALTGARTVEIVTDLLPERSLNANLNINHIMSFSASTATLDFDAFYTYFDNKIIPNYDVDPNLIVYDNLKGHGITRGFAFNYQQQFTFPLTMSLGGTFQDVFQITTDEFNKSVKEAQVFAPKFSGTFVIGYQIRPIKLSIDYTGKVMGTQHLPTFAAPNERPSQSPWYVIQNVQLTKTLKHGLEIYGGVKNLGNWTQESPLIAPDRPYSNEFDTSYAWGPLQKRRIYLGIRYAIK
jgi:outer membrane receptor for ferrienterochelin and colicins